MRLEDVLNHEALTAKVGEDHAREITSDLETPKGRGRHRADILQGGTVFHRFDVVAMDDDSFRWRYTESY